MLHIYPRQNNPMVIKKWVRSLSVVEYIEIVKTSVGGIYHYHYINIWKMVPQGGLVDTIEKPCRSTRNNE